MRATHLSRRILRDSSVFSACLVSCLVAAGSLWGQTDSNKRDFERVLAERLIAAPDDAANWRLLGRLRLERDDVEGALVACQRAVNLSPENASAHFDLGRALIADESPEIALAHFQQVVEIAPDSEYAHQAIGYLRELGAANDSDLVPPRDDLRPNRFGGISFDRSNTANRRRWDLRIDTGIVYNGNVELAPISREGTPGGNEAFQAFLSPQIELTWLSTSSWNAGVGISGYFTINEGHLNEFNLQDYQPGAFIERTFDAEYGELVARVQYDYSLNEFAGRIFGRRHSLTTSLLTERPNATDLVYWTIDFSDFADDGAIPDITSLDGWTNTIGISRTIYPERRWITLARGGADVQLAALDGSDFAYNGVFVYAESETPLPWDSWLDLQFGWGYRDYHEFTGAPSRNETLWRASAELRKEINEHWRIAGFATFDRFATDNDAFDTERWLTGIITTFQW